MTVQHAIGRPATYGPALIGLHWLMAVLIAGSFATMEIRGYYPKGSDTRALLALMHYTIGLTIFVLVAIRILARIVAPKPPIVPPLPIWQKAAAHLVYAALYAAMIVMPLLGWMILSARGKTVPFFGLSLPPLFGPDKDLAHTLAGAHEFIGNSLYFIIGIHAVAALAHHYVRKDNTLTRMLPARRERSG